MPNVKPGDLCIILGLVIDTDLNGSIVEVIEPSFDNDTFKDINGNLTRVSSPYPSFTWKVKLREPTVWKSNTGIPYLHLIIPIADLRLFKIKDKDVDIETETVKELELEKV